MANAIPAGYEAVPEGYEEVGAKASALPAGYEAVPDGYEQIHDDPGVLDYAKQFGKNVGGAALGLADIATGAIVGLPAYAAGAVEKAFGKPSKDVLNDVHEAMSIGTPSHALEKMGFDPRANPSYQAMMYPFQKIGEGIEKGNKAIGGNDATQLLAETAAMGIPIPGMKLAGKVLGKAANKAVSAIDPDLRALDKETPAATRERLGMDKVPDGYEEVPSSGESTDKNVTVRWGHPDEQGDMMGTINPYDLGGHVSGLERGETTQIDPMQPELGGRIEDTTNVPDYTPPEARVPEAADVQGDLFSTVNPYDVGGGVTDALAGRERVIDPTEQGDLFSQVENTDVPYQGQRLRGWDQELMYGADQPQEVPQGMEPARPDMPPQEPVPPVDASNNLPPEITQGMRDALDIPGFDDVGGPTPPAAKPVVDTPIEQATANVPGLGKKAQDVIFENLTPDQVIERGTGEKDGSPSMLGRVSASGANMMGLLRNSTLIKGAYQFMNRAEGVYSRIVRQGIVPIEKTLNRLSSADKQALAEHLKDEMFNKTLKEPPANIKAAYDALRKGLQDSGAMLNEARQRAGLEPITLHDYYVSSRWRGNFKSAVFDRNNPNKPVWFLREQSKRALNKAKAALDQKQPGLIYKDVDVNFKTPSDTLDAGYLEMLKLLDENDPRVQTLKDIYEKGLTENSMNSLGMPMHFENKANVRGFLGDRPNKSDYRNAVDILNSQVQYMKNSAKWSAQQEAVANIKQILSDPNLKATQPNNLKYIDEYTKHAMGFGTNADVKALESSISRGLGFDREQVMAGLNNLRSYFYTKNLGLMNIKAAAVQAIQPIFVAPALLDLNARGLKANPVTVMARTIQDFMLPNKSAIGKEALKFAEDNGFLAINVLDDVRDIGQSRAHQAFVKFANINQVKAEEFARTFTYLTMVHHLNEAGLKGDTLFQTAAAATNRVMVDYRKFEQPMWMERGGIATRSASTLKNFTNNQYNQLKYYGQQALKGNVSPLAAMLGIQFALAGTLGMYGVDSVTTAYDDYIKPALGPKYADKSARSWILEHMSDAMAYGGASKLTGMNLFSSLSAGTLGGNSMADIVAPFMTDIAKSAGAVGKAALNPNKESIAQAVYENVPPHVRGMMESLPMFQQGDTTLNPRDLDKGQFKRTEGEKVLRALGGTSFAEQTTRDRAYAAQKRELDINAAKEQLGDTYVRALRAKDPVQMKAVQDQLLKWMGPDEVANYLKNRVMTVTRQRAQDVEQRALPKTVQNISQQKKYLRMKEGMDNGSN